MFEMTNDVKLEMNMACANLLEYNIVDGYTGNVYVQRKSNKLFSGVFNIFTNSEQCLEAVKKLGDYYDISFNPFGLGGWCYEKTGALTRIDCEFKTYEEAVGAAAIEVQGEVPQEEFKKLSDDEMKVLSKNIEL